MKLRKDITPFSISRSFSDACTYPLCFHACTHVWIREIYINLSFFFTQFRARPASFGQRQKKISVAHPSSFTLKIKIIRDLESSGKPTPSPSRNPPHSLSGKNLLDSLIFVYFMPQNTGHLCAITLTTTPLPLPPFTYTLM